MLVFQWSQRYLLRTVSYLHIQVLQQLQPIFGANLGTTLLYGLIITIPTVIIAGPLFSKFLKNFEKEPPKGLFNPRVFTEEEMPSFGISLLVAIIPVVYGCLSHL